MSPVDYHRTTHLPKELGGTDPVVFPHAFFRAYLGTPLSNLSGTSQIVDWDDGWEIGGSQTGVFQPRTTTGTAATTADKVRRLDLLLPGRIEICWGLLYDFTGDAANGDVYSHFLEDDNPVLGTLYQDPIPAPSGVQGEGYLISNYSRVYPMLDPFLSGPQAIKFRWLTAWSGPTSGEDVTEGFVDVFWTHAVLPPAAS